VTISATTATFAKPPKQVAVRALQKVKRNQRNLVPIGSVAKVAPHPRYRSVALWLLRCALAFSR
jgi:hypothetical protein